MVKPFQIRAARALLSWSQQTLAERAKLNRDTINALESNSVRTHPSSIEAVVEAFENEGIRFSDDGGAYGIMLDKRSFYAR